MLRDVSGGILPEAKWIWTQKSVCMDDIPDQNGFAISLSERKPFIWGLTCVVSKMCHTFSEVILFMG